MQGNADLAHHGHRHVRRQRPAQRLHDVQAAAATAARRAGHGVHDRKRNYEPAPSAQWISCTLPSGATSKSSGQGQYY